MELNRPGDFAAESEAMGHSVRGYEPPKGHPDWVEGSGDSGYSGYGIGGWDAIKKGDAKVYSLVDPRGEPHATIEVKNSKEYGTFRNIPDDIRAQLDEQGEQIGNAKADKQGYSKFGDDRALEIRIAQSDLKDNWVFSNPIIKTSIKQIKGKQNEKPNDNYLPYIQDFVKSNNWSEIGDLKNADMYWMQKYPEVVEKYGRPWITQSEYDDWFENLNKPKKPPAPEGMKRGGAVTLEDLAMNYYVPDYNEDDYYEMPMALMPPQQRMNKGGLTQYKECNCHG